MSRIDDIAATLFGGRRVEEAAIEASSQTYTITGTASTASEDGSVWVRLSDDVTRDESVGVPEAVSGTALQLPTTVHVASGDEVIVTVYGGTISSMVVTGIVGRGDEVDGRIRAIEADYVKADVLEANYAHITDGVIDNATIGHADVDGLSANYATIASLDAAKVRIGNVEADTAKIHDLTAEQLSAATAYIASLNADDITAASLAADVAKIHDLTAQQLSAAAAYIAALVAGSVTAQAIIADHGDFATVKANAAKVANLTAAELEADHAAIGTLDTDYLRADMSNTTVGWIENGTIKEGAISNAMIGNLRANKITGGTLDASKVTVTNLQAKSIQVEKINGVPVTGKSVADALTQHETDLSDFENDVDDRFDAMQAEIDGAIETWTGTAVPTLNNAPANGWTTDKVKDTHVGDVYFVVNSSSQQNGYNYRFSKSTSGGQTTYSWQLIKDSDVTAALQRLTTAEGKIGTIEQFDSDISAWKTDTDEELSSMKTAHNALAGRVTTAEGTLATKVDTTTFNNVKQTVDENSSSITQMTTTLSNKADSSTVTAVTNRVSKNEQDISGINTTIGELQETVEAKADGSTVSTISNKLNTVSDTVDGHTQTLTSVQNTLSTKADSSTVSTLSTKVNNVSDTVDGHTSQLSSITTTQTTMQGTLDKTVKSSIQLWYSKANTTAPSKPSSKVTSDSTSGNAWRIVVPAYNSSYPHYFYCWQYEYVDGTYGWSAVVRDIAMGESQATARTADSNASAAVTTANTASTNASTALTTANTANTNASEAKTAATTASTNASEAKTTAETAASDASTAKTNAASAVTTANSASTTATNAQNTANANIKSSVQLWFTKANSTAPNKPTSVVSTSNANTANAWNLVVPVWNKNYPHYFYCYQQQKGDGNYQWTDVVYDRATSEAQQLANTTSTNLSTLQTDYATFKQTTQNFESTIGTTYATKTELKTTDDKIENLEIGGRNLFALAGSVAGYMNAAGSVAEAQSAYKERTTDYIAIDASTQYTVQAWYDTSNPTSSYMWLCLSWYTSEKAHISQPLRVHMSSSNYASWVFTSPSNAAYARISARWVESGYVYGKVKLEKGNKPTDWTPAPEDTDASIASIESRVTTAETNISQNASAIALKVNSSDVYTKSGVDGLISTEVTNRNAAITAKANEITSSVSETYATKTAVNGKADTSDVTALAGRVTTAESNITQNTDAIALRATKTEVQQVRPAYASSSTAAGTAAKVGTIDPAVTGYALYKGATVSVTFSTANTAATPTLNLNSTGAKQIRSYTGAALSEAEYKWAAGATIDLVYDGTYWRMQDGGAVKRVTAAEASIRVNADNIESKVSKDGVISSINQSAETVKIQASKVEIDGTAVFSAISSDVDDAITSKGYQTSSQVNSAITSKGYATTTQAQGYATTAKSEAISAAATDATTKANAAETNAKAYTDALEIGGRNLFVSSLASNGYPTDKAVGTQYGITGMSANHEAYQLVPVEEGASYIFQYWVDDSEHQGWVCIQLLDVDGLVVSKPARVYPNADYWTKAFTVPSGATTALISGRHLAAGYEYAKLKFEKGTKPTDWSPAPEDTPQYRVVTTSYSYALAQWLTYAAEGYTDRWTRGTSGQGVRAGDTVMLKGTNSDNGSAVYVLMTVNTLTASGAIANATSHGLIDPTAGQRADSAQSTANAAAPKTSAVKRTQRIWYRKSASGAPSTPGTASSNWVTKADDGNDAWTKMHIAISSTHKYIYTCEQYEMANGTVGYTSVLLDNTITVIDGGNIITGTVSANAINATSGTFAQANIPALTADHIKANVISAVNNGTGTINADKINVSELTIGQSQVTNLTTDLSGKASTSALTTETNQRKATYGTSSTAAGTAAKVVTCEDFALYEGATITVKFSTANTANAPTLNVNGTGAVPVWNNNAVAASTNPVRWGTNATLTFTYDGEHWVLQDKAPSYSASCSTAAATRGKSASVTGALVVTGTTVEVGFTAANEYVADSVQFNFAGTDSANVYYNNAVTSSTNTLLWSAGTSITLVRRGAYWFVADGGLRKYVTHGTGDGLLIHRADDSTTGVQIDDDVDILRSGVSVASYGDTARIGAASGNNALIDTDGMKVRSGTSVLAQFASSLIEIGKNSTSAVVKFCNGMTSMTSEMVNSVRHFIIESTNVIEIRSNANGATSGTFGIDLTVPPKGSFSLHWVPNTSAIEANLRATKLSMADVTHTDYAMSHSMFKVIDMVNNLIEKKPYLNSLSVMSGDGADIDDGTIATKNLTSETISASGSLEAADITLGKGITLSGIKFGFSSATTNSNGITTFNPGLGVAPTAVFVAPGKASNETEAVAKIAVPMVWSIDSATQVQVRWQRSDTNAWLASNAVGWYWLALYSRT